MVNVCVYASASPKTPSAYLDAATELGRLLAKDGHLCINGGGKTGGMGALNDGVIQSQGKVRGVILNKFVVDNIEHDGIKDLVVVDGNDLQERKAKLVEDADCIIALPGGTGTWDELWEAVCLNGIGLRRRPVCCVNIDGFYDGGIHKPVSLESKLCNLKPPRDKLQRKHVVYKVDPVCCVNIDGFYDGFLKMLDRASRDGLLHGRDWRTACLLSFQPTAAAALEQCLAQLARLERERARRGGGAEGEAAAAGAAVWRPLLLPPGDGGGRARRPRGRPAPVSDLPPAVLPHAPPGGGEGEGADAAVDSCGGGKAAGGRTAIFLQGAIVGAAAATVIITSLSVLYL